jgi:nicotinamidase-related amidase
MTEAARFFDYGETLVPPIEWHPPSTALMVVDMQYHDASPDHGWNLAFDRISPGSMDYFNDRNEHVVIPAISRLLTTWRENGWPVVYLVLGSDHQDLRDFPPRLRAAVRRLEERGGVEDMFWSQNPAYEIRRELAARDGELIVQKQTFGAFNSVDLEPILRERGIDAIVMTGISTNCCVETTARDAADRGFAVAIVDEATADYDEQAHDAALRGFHFNFGPIFPTVDDVLGTVGARAAR